MQTELILYAIVAAGLVFWLRSVLGTRHGDERERPNPFAQAPAEKPQADARHAGQGLEEASSLSLIDATPVLPRNVTLADQAEHAIFEIGKVMRDFDLPVFAQGAQDAFAVIVESFAQGDRDTLKNLLMPHVYEAFEAALKDREEKGEKVETEIHAVRRAEIMKAAIVDGDAHITIRFIADETCVIRDKDGVILSGDPDRITEMNDIWTFARSVKSRDPRWLLQETNDGDVKEDEKTPVPDSFTV